MNWDWDLTIKVAVAIVTAVGVVTGLMNWRTANRTGLHKLTEAELEALLTGAERAADDAPYKAFLEGVHKERLVSLAFGCAVPLQEVGRLMEYYRKGFATTEQIRLAWLHRNEHSQPLSFALKMSDKFWLWGVRVYIAACLVFGLPVFLLAVLARGGTLNALWGSEVLLFFGFAFLAFYMHRSLFVANSLAQRERQALPRAVPTTLPGRQT